MKMHTKMLVGAAVLALAALAPLALAQMESQPGTKKERGMKKAEGSKGMAADHTFATMAAQGGMAEVALGQLAQQKASSDAVKQFGQRMVDDHTKVNDELKSIASTKNIALPAEVSAKDKATMDRLSKLSGAAFDRAYMQDMVADHKKDVSEFRHESENGTDADMKAFAAKTLPTLEEHLKLAEQTAAQTKAGGKKD